MTETQKDALWKFLFASDDCRLVNLKLMRGDSQEIETEDLRNQVHSALLQIRTGTSDCRTDFPEESDGGQVKLAELAAS